MRRRTLIVFSALVAMVALLGRGVSAQDATPAAPAQQPIIPAANQCTVAPRDIAYFEQFVGAPVSASPVATPADPASIVMPEGEEPDRATRQGVLDTIRQLTACVNAGNWLAFYALCTDKFIQNDLAAAPVTEEVLAGLAAPPVPLEGDQRAAILAVVAVRVLPDGRAAAVVDFQDPLGKPPGPARSLLILVEQDGRWLVDEEPAYGPIDASQVGQPPA